MGKVYLVGAGPGAPDLITLRGADLLRRADIVFYDALVHPETVALAVRAKKVSVGKRCKQLSTDQRFINRNLVEAGLKYQVVVRLKGGDPMLFGRAQEEMAALIGAGIEYEVVPGVTSALAASAALGISLTQRGVSRSVTFATPRVGEEQGVGNWAETVASSNTSVLYMGVGQAPEIAAMLENRGLAATTPVVIVENASLPNMRKIPTTLAGLHHIAQWEITGPALILLGEVFREAINSTDGEIEISQPQANRA